jgi:glycolate oxidase iron-sulfur subunit
MAAQLLTRKMGHIRATQAPIVATANSGCLLQLINGARDHHMPTQVVHPVSLLAQAYRRESS